MTNQINIVAVSHETDKISLEELNVLAGKYGGTCYAKAGYETIKHQPEEKALKRAMSTAKRGHHSVFQHSVISFEIICSKMVAMILNSMGVSNTSEKSARYTYMHPEEPEVADIYTKWCGRFMELIPIYFERELSMEGKPFTMSDSLLEKAALDQARYMLSVFTPTSIVYSIPYRNLCYLLEWMTRMADNISSLPASLYNTRLQSELYSMVKTFKAVIGEELPFGDNKDEFLHILPYQATGEQWHIDHEILGDVYSVERQASWASVAHLLRHRTLTHWFNAAEPGEYGFYLPPLLTLERNAPYKAEWERDIQSIAKYSPQGTKVSFVEQGSFDKFILMCKERLCSRALLETQNVCRDILQSFRPEDLSPFNRKLLQEHTDKNGQPCPRCQFKDFHCVENCSFGGNRAFTRLI